MHELRRLLPRQFADWGGRYILDSDPHGLWRDCRVVDISSAGAGLELRGAPLDTAEGDHILVAVHLHAEIRNCGPTKANRLRVGTQFTDLSEAERSFLESQEKLAVHW
jgi:PilZ domain